MKGFFAGLVTLMNEPMLWLKGAIVFLIGPIDLNLAYLMLAMLVDLTFGIQVAIREKAFSWKKLVVKFGSKVAIYSLWIIMFHAFDKIAGLPETARWSLVFILAGMEILSAIKNTSKLGHNVLAEALSNLYLSLMLSKRHHHKGGTEDERSIEIEIREPKPRRDEDDKDDEDRHSDPI